MVVGNDTIAIKGDSQGNTIYGDGRISYYDTTKKTGPVLGNDLIEIQGNSVGESVYGDVYDAQTGSVGGNDTIRVGGNSTGSSIYGDAYYLRTGTKGGSDLIHTKGHSQGESIYGDAYTSEAQVKSGHDTIQIDGNMAGNTMYGDSFTLGDNSTGGNDLILIKGTMTNGLIRGDSEGSGANVIFGNDTIKIGNVVGTTTDRASALITGDSGSSGYKVTFGNDLIQIGNVTNATIRGDAQSAGTSSVLGNDTIIVSGTMKNTSITGDTELSSALTPNQVFGHDYIKVHTFESGRIHGDSVTTLDASATPGNDTIVINNLVGTGEKIIDGGAGGKDLFVYDNASGHTISLNNAGTVSIDGNAKYNNTSITNFEGLGGGAGNDLITGNDYDNVLFGGLGDDTLTGGKGADTFVWKTAHFAGGTDKITDFSFAQNDIIRFEDMAQGGNDNIIGKIVDNKLMLEVHHDGFTQNISVDILGTLNVQGQTYNNFNDFNTAYEHSNYDQDMINTLINQMTIFGG